MSIFEILIILFWVGIIIIYLFLTITDKIDKKSGKRIEEGKALLRKGQIPQMLDLAQDKDAAQGREWNTVIFSIADPFPGWFTDTKKAGSDALQLINTAVSRTKRNIIILCNKSVWGKQNGQFLTCLIQHSN